MSLIPSSAKKIFQGHAYVVYQREQTLLDGATALFDQVQRNDTVQVIATQDGKVLMSDEIQPYVWRRTWLFGGHVDKGEDVLEAAKRELLEEAWINRKVHYYLARNCQKIQECGDRPGEKITVMQVSYEDFIAFVYQELFAHIDLFPFIKIIIDRHEAQKFISFLQWRDGNGSAKSTINQWIGYDTR